MDTKSLNRLIDLIEVKRQTGMSRATIYERMARSTFPARVRLSPQRVLWVESEIQAFIAAQIAARDDAEPTQKVA
jgi:prophage regulatory protein